MRESEGSQLTQRILSARPKKNSVDPFRPYQFLVEPECNSSGQVEDVATIFLTNRECTFKCLMCDLWKNTLDFTVPPGAISQQIDFALRNMPEARHIKLYNSGNFFDPQQIPQREWPAIGNCVRGFDSVIVENHPRLCDDRIARFQPLLGESQLEIALGLETSHEATLAKLNKQMTPADFAAACRFLLDLGVRIRAFVLLRPPGVSEEQGVEQAISSARFAFDCGVDCVAIIPTRNGNGILDQMLQAKAFDRPSLKSLETVLQETISWKRGRVLVDLWDVEKFSSCRHCATQRTSQLRRMNLTQSKIQRPRCEACEP